MHTLQVLSWQHLLDVLFSRAGKIKFSHVKKPFGMLVNMLLLYFSFTCECPCRFATGKTLEPRKSCSKLKSKILKNGLQWYYTLLATNTTEVFNPRSVKRRSASTNASESGDMWIVTCGPATLTTCTKRSVSASSWQLVRWSVSAWYDFAPF